MCIRDSSSVVLDPAEERIKTEFEGVKRTWLPLQSVLRVDEVKKGGPSKISAYDGSNVAPFPMPILPGGPDPGSRK